jgi:tRNA A-37 threonylcarbamoyl transferase component Bud32
MVGSLSSKLPASIKRAGFFRGRGKVRLVSGFMGGSLREAEELIGEAHFVSQVQIKKAYLRSRIAKASSVSKWRTVRFMDEAALVFVPNFGKVVVKPCLGYSAQEVLAKLVELAKRRVRCEAPLGLLVSRERDYLVTKYFDGQTLGEAMNFASRENKLLMARLVGQELADLHKKEFFHGHPHLKNWVVVKGKIWLIDATLLEDLKDKKANRAADLREREVTALNSLLKENYGEEIADVFRISYHHPNAKLPKLTPTNRV